MNTLLVRWMAYANIAYRQVELPQFHDLLQLAYADIDAIGCLPTADTMVRWTRLEPTTLDSHVDHP